MESSPLRSFLGWNRPALASAAQFLVRERPDGDLADHLIVTPGGRASRLMLGELLDRTPTLSPPRFCTPGQVADFLLPSRRDSLEPAGPLMRRLAWVAALRGCAEAELQPLAPRRPEPGDLRAWWQIAGMLEAAQSELAAELVLFEEVPGIAAGEGGGVTRGAFPDAERWRAAGLVQRRYERLLAAEGLVDPDLRVLHLLRGEAREVGRGPVRRVVLLGVAELARGVRAALTCFATAIKTEGIAAPVLSLVFAPEEFAERFDEFGAVVPDRWTAVDLPQVRFAEGPGDQAQLALEAIAGLNGRYPAHGIVIGVPDAEVTAFLERKADQVAAVEVRDGERRSQPLRVRAATGWPLAQTGPFRLLQCVGAFVEESSFASLAAAVRHPDIERHLLQRGADLEAGGDERGEVEWWLDELDRYQAEHVPGVLDGEWHTEDAEAQRRLAWPHEMMRALAAELLEAPDRRPLPEWAGALRAVMMRIYGGMQLSRTDPAQRRTIEGNIAIRDALVELERAAKSDPALVPVCTAQMAIGIILEIAGAGGVPEEGDDDAIELLGWLELPLDPAPAAIVTGLNEGKVPPTTTGDAFLPDGLREALGIASNRRRCARDLYTLAAVAASREHVTLIAGRRAADHSPLAPSRLLFACDAEQAVERVRLFTGDLTPGAQLVRIASRVRAGAMNRFRDRPIVPAEAVTSMRVTSFRTFLASPYLFYLEHILGLEEREDSCLELDPLAYGSLIHEVLERFGKSDVRHSTDERVIEACVLDELATLAKVRFGGEPSTCIWLQLEFARRRLREFSCFQAERRRGGWLIEDAEWRPPTGHAIFMVDGVPLGLRGTIDRIERNESTGVWAVLDYKTGDTVPEPGTAHRGRAGWRDLQLPLYRHLAAQLKLPDDPDRLVLGYIALPKKPGGVQVLEAGWDAAELAEADEVAREVVRRVRAGDFLDIGDRPPDDGVKAALAGVGFVGAGRRAKRSEEEGDES